MGKRFYICKVTTKFCFRFSAKYGIIFVSLQRLFNRVEFQSITQTTNAVGLNFFGLKSSIREDKGEREKLQRPQRKGAFFLFVYLLICKKIIFFAANFSGRLPKQTKNF